jgi:translation elongation factor EF-1alpha
MLYRFQNCLGLMLLLPLHLIWHIYRFFVPYREKEIPKKYTSPLPVPEEAPDFVFKIEEVISMRHLGDVVIVGRLETGTMLLGQMVKIISADELQIHVRQIRDMEMQHQRQTIVFGNERIGLLIPDLTRDDIQAGMIIRPA